MKDTKVSLASQVDNDDDEEEKTLNTNSPENLKRRFPFMYFASNILFIMGSVLYLVMAIDDYRWAQTLLDLPMWLRIADDDTSWMNYRLEERYNASLLLLEEDEEESSSSGGNVGSGGNDVGGRLRLVRRLQFLNIVEPRDSEPTTTTTEEEEEKQEEIQDELEGTFSPLDTDKEKEEEEFVMPSPGELFYDEWWIDLPDGIREAYSVLGYNESSWNNATSVPTDVTYWDDLTPQEEQAALFIGYDKDMWDKMVTTNLNNAAGAAGNSTASVTTTTATTTDEEEEEEEEETEPATFKTIAPSDGPTSAPVPVEIVTTPSSLEPAPEPATTTTTTAAPGPAPTIVFMFPTTTATQVQQTTPAPTSNTVTTTATTTTTTAAAAATPADLYYDEFWADLPPLIQNAYKILGYNETIWNQGLPTEVDDLYWAEMTYAQQQAASFIGYTEEAWNTATTAPIPTPAPTIVFMFPTSPTTTTTTTTTDTQVQQGGGGGEDSTTNTATEEATSSTATTTTTTDEHSIAPGYYDQFGWDELPPEAQAAAAVLGYDQNKWDTGAVVESEDYWFAELSPEQQAAAAVLGYDEASWNGGTSTTTTSSATTTNSTTTANGGEGIDPSEVEAGYYDQFGWNQLPSHVQEAAGVLGYDQTSWDTGSDVESSDSWWKDLSPEQQEAAAILGYDEYSWNGVDAEIADALGMEGEYVSYDDDYIFEVKSTGTWVSRYMILYFCAALCFLFVGLLDLIRERHAFHILMIIGGATGVISAMLVERHIHNSNIFNAVSVHFYMLEAFTLFGNHKRAAMTEDDYDSKFLTNLLAFGDLLFGVGALLDVVLSYFYLFDDTSDWDTNMSITAIAAAVSWLVCSIIYVGVFFYEYNKNWDTDLANEKGFHSSDEEEGVKAVKIVADTTDGSEKRDHGSDNGKRGVYGTEETARITTPDDSTDDLSRNDDGTPDIDIAEEKGFHSSDNEVGAKAVNVVGQTTEGSRLRDDGSNNRERTEHSTHYIPQKKSNFDEIWNSDDGALADPAAEESRPASEVSV